MSAIDKLATSLGASNDVPNQELAREIANNNDSESIKELIDCLNHRDKNIQSDCIKTLYETGYIKPELLSGYVDILVELLGSKNNRLVWGALIALSTVANLDADAVYKNRQAIVDRLNDGSVIAVDAAVKTLALTAAAKDEYRKTLLPVLLDFLKTCRAKSVPMYAEFTAVAVTHAEAETFTAILVERDAEYSDSQRKRVMKVIKDITKKGKQ